jgi:hypothetical protein
VPPGPFLGAMRCPGRAKTRLFQRVSEADDATRTHDLLHRKDSDVASQPSRQAGPAQASFPKHAGRDPRVAPVGFGCSPPTVATTCSSNQAPRGRQGDTLKKDQRAVAPRWSPSPRNEPRIRYGTPRLKCFFPAAEPRWSGRASLGSGGRCRAATRRQRRALSPGRA